MRVVAETPDFLMLFSYIRDTWATLTIKFFSNFIERPALIYMWRVFF